ncbi:MAG: ATP-binding SpoIIE family protein phosphatase [Gammaproteobacteria bacterium]
MSATSNELNAEIALSRHSVTAKVLVADANENERRWFAQVLEATGYSVIPVKEGRQVLELFVKERPDLVILDIAMPNMDGIAVAECLKATNMEEYIPILFITNFSDEAALRRCIDIGCDGFISHPLNPSILLTKVNSLLRVKRLYQDQLEQKKKLMEYQRLIAQEQEVAATLYKNFIHADFLATPELKYLLSPMALFNGDILLAAKTPGNNLHVLLGDFTGHGLSASIGAAPAAEIFYGMTEKGFGITEIIAEINHKMLKLLPVNMFLAATIVALYADSKTLSLIPCGLPDHYLHNKVNGSIRTIRSKNLPLGITDSFNPVEKNIEIDSSDYLYLLTDGVIEAQDNRGIQFGTDGVMSCLRTVMSGFEAIRDAFQAHTQGLEQQDDITLVELYCNIDNPKWKQVSGAQKNVEIEPIPWKSSMEFHISALRKVNPVPIMVNSIMEIQGFKAHREAIFMIVSELFANALDHGLLELESDLKSSPEGFMHFYELRQERLLALTEGSIGISFSHVPSINGGALTIEVQDSGKGFDVEDIFSALEGNNKTYGRGIDLVKRLCQSVEYSGFGSRVKAVYAWTV